MNAGPEPNTRDLSRVPAYPALIAAAYVLYIAFADDVAPPGFVRPLIWTVAFAGALTLVCAALSRSWRRGAIWSIALLLLVASYEWLVQLIAFLNRTFGAGAVAAFGAIVVVAAFVGAAGALVARRHRDHALAATTRGLNILSLALLGIVAISGVGDVTAWLETRAESAARPTPGLPDIYFILLDGYPRADVLSEDFAIDNGAFTDGLERLGLRVSADSHANYTFTLLTLSSVFRGDYVPLTNERGEALTQARVRTGFDEAALRGDAVLALRNAGYEIAASAEGFEHVNMRTAADHFMEREQLTDLEMLLLRSTWLIDLPLVPRDWLIAEQRSRVNAIFDDAAAFVGQDREHPVLALVHVPSPHAPVVFGRDGGPVPWGSRQFGAAFAEEYGVSQQEFLEVYADQLDYLHGRTLDLVDHIRSMDPDAAVVVFSDHGTAPEPWSDPRNQLPNLMATYFPDDPLTDEEASTPVQLMRAVLRRYAGVDPPALQNRYWVAHEDEGLIVVEESTPLR